MSSSEMVLALFIILTIIFVSIMVSISRRDADNYKDNIDGTGKRWW